MVAAVGVFMIGNAIGLVDPEFILRYVGLAIADYSTAAYQLGEVRAVYGGLFAVVGIFTLLSAIDPAASRSRLVLLAWCWLGLGGGRLLGALVDGDPGRRGWFFIAVELAGGALLLSCTTRRIPWRA